MSISITLSIHANQVWDECGLDAALDSVADGLEYRNERPSGFGDDEGDWFATLENHATPLGTFHVLFTGTHGNDHSPMTSGNTHATLYDTSDPDDMEKWARDVAKWEAMPEEDPDADWGDDEESDEEPTEDDPDAEPADDESEWDFACRINGERDNLDGVFIAMIDANNHGDRPLAIRLARIYHGWLTFSGRTMSGYSLDEAWAVVRSILA